MIRLNRREVLKALAAVGVTGATLPFGVRHMVFAADSSPSVLVVMHLRGGCDGLNFISPANDPDFIAARSSDLRVLADGKDAGYALGNPGAASIDFRLHNAAGGLNELYQSRNMAFVHACGLTDATRSHFVATDMIEAGVGTQADLAHREKGWLARAIDAQGGGHALKAVAASGAVAGDLDGLDLAIAAPDISNGLPVIGGAAIATTLWQMYRDRSDAVGEAGALALELPLVVDQHIPRDADGRVIPYAPEHGASYDSAAGLAGTLKTVARLIKMDIGLQAITLDYGSFDTHENQPGRFRGLIEPMSNGLAAFWNDLSAYHDRLTLITVTEFGRRLRSNKSNGTDHGRAGVMTVLGGGVRGGRIYGTWPGLRSEQLDEGVDLAVTTDYRQVLSETFDHVAGRGNNNLFPNFRQAGSLGIFG